ncbi:MAG: hypothetical protein WA988_14780 [Candidatus Nanopelagicales bacterium]
MPDIESPVIESPELIPDIESPDIPGIGVPEVMPGMSLMESDPDMASDPDMLAIGVGAPWSSPLWARTSAGKANDISHRRGGSMRILLIDSLVDSSLQDPFRVYEACAKASRLSDGVGRCGLLARRLTGVARGFHVG